MSLTEMFLKLTYLPLSNDSHLAEEIKSMFFEKLKGSLLRGRYSEQLERGQCS